MEKIKDSEISYLYLFWVLVVVIAGFSFDYYAGNYSLSYSTIDIALGQNVTEHKTIVTVPPLVQILRLAANFFYGLAVTLFVTIFVVGKIEKRQKEKHEKELDKLREEININVFDALFKTLIPSEIFQIVKSEIIENKAIRKKAHWTFVFEECDGGIKMTSTTHYELHNVSKEPLTEPVNIEMEPLSSQEQEILKAKCLSSDGSILVEFNKSDPENCKNMKIVHMKGGGKKVSYTLSVPPNDFIVSTFEHCAIYTDKIYDCQHTKYPIIDLNINSVFPKGYEFIIHPALSSDLKEISCGATHRNFRVEGGILPRQGIVFVLEKSQMAPAGCVNTCSGEAVSSVATAV